MFTRARLVEFLAITDDQADQVIRLIRSQIHPFDYPGVARWADQCYHTPSGNAPETIMKAIDEVIGTCGTEAIFADEFSCTRPVFEYCNTGDSYAGTIAYDYARGKYLLTSYGDWVEKNDRKYSMY